MSDVSARILARKSALASWNAIFTTPALASAWVGWSVASVTACACVSMLWKKNDLSYQHHTWWYSDWQRLRYTNRKLKLDVKFIALSASMPSWLNYQILALSHSTAHVQWTRISHYSPHRLLVCQCPLQWLHSCNFSHTPYWSSMHTVCTKFTRPHVANSAVLLHQCGTVRG